MSRNTGSSRHQSHASRSTNPNTEDLVEQVKSIVTQLYAVVSSSSQECERHVPSARSAMATLDRLRFFRDPARFTEQVWIIQGLQDFAYHDADSGCIEDVADYCQTSWLEVLRNFPENVEALTGLGHNWLQRAQATLARIHREESDGSSSGSTGDYIGNPPRYGVEDDADYSGGSMPSDPRRQGPLYIEARGTLQPAVDFFERAVRSADALGGASGDLLAATAECQISLGNVTSSSGDERIFSQAIRYLRRAEAIPGYTLSVYLAQYLNEYGRYVS